MRRLNACLLSLAFAAGPARTAHAAATITVTVTDAPGEGFNDPTAFAPVGGNNATTLGEARLLAFRHALGIIADCIDSSVPIEIEASFDPLACTTTGAVLGYGTAKTVHRDFAGAPLSGTYYSAALANALAATDLAPADADIEMAFNSDLGMPGCLPTKPWYYGLDGNTIDTDFVTVVLHEVCHGLGFQTYMNTTSGSKFMGWDDRYLTWLEDHFAFPAGYPAMTDGQRAAGNTDDPNLHWTGPSVTAAGFALSGGVSNGHVRMHGPATLVPGSSVHHFASALFPNQLMEPTINGDNHDIGLAVNLFDDLGWGVRNTTLAAACDGAVMELAAPTGPAPNLTGGPGLSNTEWGLYVTANQHMQVCAVGIRTRNQVGQTITATVYRAHGTTRGAPIASGALTITQSALQYQYVPLSATLEACEDYEIAVTVGDVSEFYYWDKNALPLLPFDTANGVVRVRDSSYWGSVQSIPYVFEFSLVGETTAITNMQITDPAVTWASCVDSLAAPRGVYVHANETSRLCSVAIRNQFSFSDFGRTIRANVYAANGAARQQLLATGTAEVTSFGSLDFTPIPVDVLLREGFDYDIEVELPATEWSCWDEGAGLGPFDIGPLTLVDAETGGDATSPLLGRFLFQYAPLVSNDVFDIVGPFHGSPDGVSTVAPVETGIVVRAQRDVDVYAVGLRADVPADLLLVAQVYEAPGGVRGPLIADGFIESGASGMRWHDIPVDLQMSAGRDFDIAVIVPVTNGWEYWNDGGAPPVPYNAHGLFEVLDAEQNGNTVYTELPHLRLGACPSRPALVGVGPTVPPSFALSSWPNPVSATATIRYTLDAAAPVTVAVYDVRGRRVATLVRSPRLSAGPHQVDFDASSVASGVYFVKVEARGRQLARKLVVMR